VEPGARMCIVDHMRTEGGEPGVQASGLCTSEGLRARVARLVLLELDRETRQRGMEFSGSAQAGLVLWSAASDASPAPESVEDPLEEHLHPSPAEPSVRFGQPVYLRTFYGRYIDVERCSVQARWADKGLWQELSFVPAADARGDAGREVKSGDVVRIQAHNGKFLTVVDGKVTATSRATAVASAPSEFVVKVKVVHQGGNVVKHRAIINLRCRANSCPVAASDAEEGLFVSGKGPLDEMDDYAWYQELAVEKQIEDIAPATPPKSSIPEEAAIATGATPRRRKTSTPQTLKQVDELTPSPVSTKKRRVSGNTSAGEVSTPGKLGLKEQPPSKMRRVC